MWGGVSYKQHTLDLATVQLKFQNRINVCVHYYMLLTGILLTSSPPLFHMHYWATTRTMRNTCVLQFHVLLMWISRIFIDWYSYNSTKFVLKQNYKKNTDIMVCVVQDCYVFPNLKVCIFQSFDVLRLVYLYKIYLVNKPVNTYKVKVLFWL